MIKDFKKLKQGQTARKHISKIKKKSTSTLKLATQDRVSLMEIINFGIQKSRTFYQKLTNFPKKSSSQPSKLNDSVKQTNRFAKPKNKSRSFIAKIFRLPVFIFELIFSGLGKQFKSLTRTTTLEIFFVTIFVILIFNFIQLQVIANNGIGFSSGNLILNITPSTRGKIFIRDLQANNKPIEVTSSRILFNVFIEPDSLKTNIKNGVLTKNDAIKAIAGSLNLSMEEVSKIINEELAREPVGQYRIIQKFITKEQKEATEHLRAYGYNSSVGFRSWLGIEQVEVRSYPEESFLGSLASTIGYVQREPVSKDEASKISNCRQMIRENELRNTVNSYTGKNEDGRYIVGLYGIEQKFCSELGGLNGRPLLGSELGSKTEEDVAVVHGSDIFLTIDKNMQLKAQEILDELVSTNTNAQGGPVDGTVLIVDVKNNPGAILAMASYPFADPNEYYKNIDGFRNSATSVNYEVGSVMKPLTVAAALNEYATGQVDKDGQRIGISPEATFLGYDEKGKPYPENNGNILYLRNADGMSYLSLGPQSISNCLRDSINTCLADIQPTIGNLKTKEYFEDRYLIGQPSLVSLPGDDGGNVQPLQDNIYSDYTYGAFGFGQGFTTSPLQLVRAYTVLANDGKLIEPYLVDKIIDSQYRIYDSDSFDSPESIRQKAQIQVIEPKVANQVTEYLVNVVDQGYLGVRPSKGKVPGYTIAGKTGTAQVSRPYKGSPCGYDCNTMLGIYDHTYIGYGPVSNPEVIVLIKLSQPQPGVIRNYAENTLGPGFSKMMGWTLDYLGVPKETGR